MNWKSRVQNWIEKLKGRRETRNYKDLVPSAPLEELSLQLYPNAKEEFKKCLEQIKERGESQGYTAARIKVEGWGHFTYVFGSFKDSFINGANDLKERLSLPPTYGKDTSELANIVPYRGDFSKFLIDLKKSLENPQNVVYWGIHRN